MTEHPAAGPRPGAPQPGFPNAGFPQPGGAYPGPQPVAAHPGARTPSGLFPSAPAPPGPQPRPTYYEPHRVRGPAVAAGAGATAGWLLLFGLLGGSLRDYAWWTVFAGGIAWLVALVLSRLGDRGVAVGIATVTALAWAIAATAVAVRWATGGDWPLW